MYIYVYKKCVHIYLGKKFYFGIEIGNVMDLLHLVLQGIAMEVEFIFSMTGIVFLVQFRVLTNLTLMGIEADVGTCVSLPKPHGLSWGD